ncbi:MAG TPA: NAD(P)/FAD-dependent oxidoreductase [Candidatus Limnocylindrales bacterium]|nr:NAD(P)/FAD-dependent oxidoreductase [Candidatus Limnocylindrales bacterium]
MGPVERREVVVVGGGPAGAAVAIGLARRGRDVLVLERAPSWHWRACGVFTSPAAIAALRRLGLEATELEAVARPVPAMRVETASGTRFRLTYGDDGSLRSPAVGLDRSRLDPLLLARAREAGAEVREGAAVREVEAGEGRVELADGATIEAAMLVGADGIRSVVARHAGVVRAAVLSPRTGLTFHVADPSPAVARDARMVVFEGGYVGLAPVPDGRVNVGIVLGRRWRERLRSVGAAGIVGDVLRGIPPAADDPVDWATADGSLCDRIEGAAPIGHRVSRRHGGRWILVGDAAGFLDPFTGEGLHRALVSAELATRAIDRHLHEDRDALPAYDRAMAARFRAKDAVSLLVQAFLSRPVLFERAARRLADRVELRETMGLVMGDQTPASRALDPRFVADLLRP